MARSRSIRSAGDDGPQPFPTSACRKTAPTCRNAAPPRPPDPHAGPAPRTAPRQSSHHEADLHPRGYGMRGRLWLLGLLICAGCSRGPDLVVIHSPGQDNNTAGWCTQNGIAFTLKNNGDQPAPTDKLAWRPMEGTRSFREVFAHVAAEGNTETAMFGRPLPAGSLADFDAEEARLKKLPDDQLIAVMDRAMQKSERHDGRPCHGRRSIPRSGITDRALCPARRRPIPSTTCTSIWASWWRMPG